VADFGLSKIWTFGPDYQPLNFPFVDENSSDPIPDDYAPINIVCLENLFYVIYNRRNPLQKNIYLTGTGYGFISIFDHRGKFLRRFASRGPLNAPYSLDRIPTYFGYPANAIMVGNFGDGKILIYQEDGKSLGPIKDANGLDIVLDGLRSVNGFFSDMINWTASSDYLRIGNIGSIIKGKP
jgi:uncharacterized protein (TIGR03118 family)